MKRSSSNKSEADWKKELTEEQYRVLRQKGTERPFTGQYNMHFEAGNFMCSLRWAYWSCF